MHPSWRNYHPFSHSYSLKSEALKGIFLPQGKKEGFAEGHILWATQEQLKEVAPVWLIKHEL